MTPEELVEKFGRARIGIDGDCGFALLGENIQGGECEFVRSPSLTGNALRWCAKQALDKLRERLGLPDLSYYVENDYWVWFTEPRVT